MPFAHTYGPAFVFALGILVVVYRSIPSQKWIAPMTVILSAIIVTLSLTRGVWIGIIVASLAVTFLRHWKFGLSLVALFAVTFLVTFFASSAARERVMTTNNNVSDQKRMILWKGNLAIVQDYPLLGTGYSQNKLYLPTYYEKLGYSKDQFVSHAHNQYLHLLAGTGILGLMAYLVFLCTVFFFTLKAYLRLPNEEVWLKGLALGSLGAQLCFNIGAFTESNFSIAKNRYMFLFVAAIGVSIYYRHISKANVKFYSSEKNANPLLP
ncbi:MAG: O-antigen ligase domain-containing protein [Proteobacteria bacterium]|nr:MAG: O-antigen ligase domain-containing protein [Pseudomonadota bacterium]